MLGKKTASNVSVFLGKLFINFYVNFSWKCSDRRFYVDEPSETVTFQCKSDKTYSGNIEHYKCKPKFCDNPLKPEDNLNCTFSWDGNLVQIGDQFIYNCKDGTALNDDTSSKLSADTSISTDNDGIGDSDNVTINCQWRKAWSPWPVLPKCIITHCVDPLSIPEDSYLEEMHTSWVAINTEKWYQCADRLENGSHTKFFESDRSKSSFSMTCQPNGLFKFVNLRENWPTCLSTVHCGQPPNEPSGGLRTWTRGLELNDTYFTQVKYKCVNGSQFDTNGDLAGDSKSITT